MRWVGWCGPQTPSRVFSFVAGSAVWPEGAPCFSAGVVQLGSSKHMRFIAVPDGGVVHDTCFPGQDGPPRLQHWWAPPGSGRPMIHLAKAEGRWRGATRARTAQRTAVQVHQQWPLLSAINRTLCTIAFFIRFIFYPNQTCPWTIRTDTKVKDHLLRKPNWCLLIKTQLRVPFPKPWREPPLWGQATGATMCTEAKTMTERRIENKHINLIDGLRRCFLWLFLPQRWDMC